MVPSHIIYHCLLIFLFWLILLVLIFIIRLIIPLLPLTKVYMDLITSCLLSKPWPIVEPKVTLSVGKFSVEKIAESGPCWAKLVEFQAPRH